MRLRIILCLSLFLVLSGCNSDSPKQDEITKETMKAFYTEQPINVDGLLDDPIWETAQMYPLQLSRDKTDASQQLIDSGSVRFAWDEEFFYLAASFEDSDIIAQGTQDKMHHYQLGDLCELFLKPANDTYYWELYVTPASKKSSFFWPSKGCLGLPDCLEKYNCGLKVAANCDGSLNNWQDKDKRWTAEMAMPIKDLEAFGSKFDPQNQWHIFIGRYNYSRYLNEKELSMAPQLSRTGYHLLDEYAVLELVR